MKVVAAKLGLDGHYRGIKFVTRVLRDAGAEVVYLGFHKSAGQVARVAIDEDAELVALSFLSPDYMEHVAALRERLTELGGDSVGIILGGLVDPDDRDALKELGVDRVFGPETRATELLDYLGERYGLGAAETASERS